MAALPYMQLYVADYLADTTHLNAAQHGAYLLLLMNYWQRGRPLPDSNDRLAIVARMSNEEWAANRSIIAEFFEVDNGEWVHDRVERDLRKVKGVSDAGRVAGLASAKARKQKASNDCSTTVEKPLNENSTIQIRTDTDTDKKQQKPRAPESNVITLCQATGIFDSRDITGMTSLVAAHMKQAKKTLAQTVEHLAGRWALYQKEMNGLEWQYSSAAKFFMSGNWDTPQNWPRKNGHSPPPNPGAQQTTISADEAYLRWQSMSEAFKRANPWRQS